MMINSIMIKPCPKYKGYGADELGNCYSFFRYLRSPNGKIRDRVADYTVKPKKLSIQYKKEKGRSQIRPHVAIRRNGKRVKVLVARLVALTFLKNPRNYPAVRHLNDIPSDNRLSNLRWGTNRVNIKEREKNQNKDLLIEELQDTIKRLTKELLSK